MVTTHYFINQNATGVSGSSMEFKTTITTSPQTVLTLDGSGIKLIPGSATYPSLRFTGASANTGIYSSSDSVIFAATGNAILTLDTNGIKLASGSATYPSLRFTGTSTNTGIYSSSDSIIFAAAGNPILTFNTNGIKLTSGTLANPSLNFGGTSANTGLYLPSTDTIGFVSDGYLAGSFTSTGSEATSTWTIGNASSTVNHNIYGGITLSNTPSTLPTTGIYRSATFALVFSTNTTNVGLISATGAWTLGATSSTVNHAINGTIVATGGFGAAKPRTTTTSATITDADYSIICNGTAAITLTLPAASALSGKILVIKTLTAFAVNSASSNIVPISSTTAGTSILTATAGKWAMLQSDGTNWIVMMSN